MKNIIKKIEYYWEATLETTILEITIMVLIPLLIATPLVLLIWGAIAIL